jgi:hypothetical protein
MSEAGRDFNIESILRSRLLRLNVSLAIMTFNYSIGDMSAHS